MSRDVVNHHVKSLRQRLALWVPNCPEPLMDEYLLASFRQFCKDTEIWQYEQTDLAAQDNEDGQFILSPPPCTIILRILEIQQAPTTEASSPPTSLMSSRWSFEPPFTLIIPEFARNAPENTLLRVRMALAPGPNFGVEQCAGCDFIARWYDPIVAGAASYLLRMPMQPWTQQPLHAQLAMQWAAMADMQYWEGVTNALAERDRQYAPFPEALSP